MSATFFRVVFKHFSDLFLFVLSPALTPGMINQHTKSTIIPNAPHFPTHDKMFFFSRKFCHPQDTSFRHVANSHEQKLTSTCCLSVKMTDECFSFPHVCAITPPRHDSAQWELKSWRENLEILTYFWLPEPKIVSITLLLTRPGFVPGPWGFLTSWRHLEHQDEDSVICQWLGPEIKR